MNKLGVSTVIGVMLMIVVAVLASILVSQNVLTATKNEIESVRELHTNIVLFQKDDKIYLQHKGGEGLADYQVYINGQLVIQGDDMVIGDIIEIPIPNGDNTVHFTSDNEVLFDGVVSFDEPEPEIPILPAGIVNMTYGYSTSNIVRHNLTKIPSCVLITCVDGYPEAYATVYGINETCFSVKEYDFGGNIRSYPFYWCAFG